MVGQLKIIKKSLDISGNTLNIIRKAMFGVVNNKKELLLILES